MSDRVDGHPSSRIVVAAFDFDETITHRDSVVPFLKRVAGTRALVLGMLARMHRALLAVARRDRDGLRLIVTEVAFRNAPAAAIETLGIEHGLAIIAEGLRTDTVDRIRWHLDEGHRVLIVSASYEQYVRVVADHLGIHGVAATRLEVAPDGRLTGRLDGPNCRAAEKVVRLDAWLVEHDLTRADVTLWAYGDSRGDRELLAAADHPVWVAGPLDSFSPTA